MLVCIGKNHSFCHMLGLAKMGVVCRRGVRQLLRRRLLGRFGRMLCFFAVVQGWQSTKSSLQPHDGSLRFNCRCARVTAHGCQICSSPFKSAHPAVPGQGWAALDRADLPRCLQKQGKKMAGSSSV